MNAVTNFEGLCRDAAAVLDKDYSLHVAEPFFLKALEIIKANPQLQPEFELALIRAVDGGLEPFEIAEFCMRELRWPAIREHAAEKIKTADPRSRQVLQRVLSVYEPVWEDADLYEYYRQPKKRAS
jgi:hypothetical protein